MHTNTTILLACFCLMGCSKRNTSNEANIKGVTVSVIVDMSDKMAIKPGYRDIAGFFHCDRHPDASLRFAITAITDKQNNPVFSSHLANGKTTEQENVLDDIQYRKKRVLQFYRQTEQAVTAFYANYDTTQSMGYSECWATVCKSLAALSADTSDKRFLLVYSDLLENGDYNAYRNIEKMAVAQIAEQLTKTAAVPGHVAGIQILVIYAPKDRAADKRFRRMYGAVRLLLEKSGVAVSTQATNQFNTL